MKEMNKTLSRIFVYLSCIALLVGMMVFPASASSIGEDPFIDLLDYVTVNNSGSNNVSHTGGTGTFTIDNSFGGKLNYVELYVYGTQVSSFSISDGSTSRALTVHTIGNQTYKVYGYCGNIAYDTLHFTYTSGNSSGTLSIQNCRISNWSYSSQVTGSCEVWGAITGNKSVTMADYSSPAQVYFGGSSETVEPLDSFGAYLYINDYLGFDYVDVYFSSYVAALNSISVYCGPFALPFEITYINQDASGMVYYFADTADLNFNAETTTGLVKAVVRIDLSSLKRNNGYTPVIDIRGLYDCETSVNYVSLDKIVGFFYETVDKWQYWFSDLKDFLSDIFKPNQSTQNQIDSSIQENECIDQEISDGILEFGEDPGNLDLDSNLGEIGADPSHFITFFTIIFNDYYIMRIFWVAALIMIIGYIFHGQR